MEQKISYIDELKSFIEKEGFTIRKAAKLGEVHYSNLFYILNGKIEYNSEDKKRKFNKFESSKERCKFILGKLIEDKLKELSKTKDNLDSEKQFIIEKELDIISLRKKLEI
jgi:predicted transcriptional regulator